MDPTAVAYVSYRWHKICNPFSLEQLERTLAFADLKPGDKAGDLGSGNGFVAAWIAERYGLDQTAVERYAPVADLARQTAARPLKQGKLTVVEGTAEDYLATAGLHRLISVMGAVDLIPGCVGPAQTIAALSASLAPGGWLLCGDPFWRGEPTARITETFAAARFSTLPGWVAAGEAAGLTPYHVATTTHAEWEEYVWRMNASFQAYADESPPQLAAAIRLRAKTLRDAYLEEGREIMGFGLYLFRKPLA